MKITPTSLTITQLFGSGNEQYVIPAYQRRYSWQERQVWELIDDIRLIEENDTHLLGSIVCLAGHHTAGINCLELVDGQQRLTTIMVILECIREHLDKAAEVEEVADLGRLLTCRALGGKPVRKVTLDSIDSEEFEWLVEGNDDEHYKNLNLKTTFKIVRGWIAGQKKSALAKFLYRLKNQAMVIRLDVSDAKDAFKLFETINNRGLRLSPTDIIKNFLLGNAARFGANALQLARATWAELISHLDGTNADAFFRYYLMALLKTRVTAAEVVAQFKMLFMGQVTEATALPDRHLYADVHEEDEEEQQEAVAENDSTAVQIPTSNRIEFKTFLKRLSASARVYGELVLGNTGDARIDRHLRNLRMIKAVQTYGFLMHLRLGKCSDKHFLDVIKLTEGFVLRRHVCRERANETEALFARLCGVDTSDPVPATREAYRGLCPPDDRFGEDFASTEYPANLIDRARYCLEQIEVYNYGEHAELQVLGADDVHVEHIIPQKIKTKRAKEEFGDWVEYLGSKAEAMHPSYVGRIGNLTLFAGALNIGASNNPFHKKRKSYKESGIELTRELSRRSNFKFKDVEKRSKTLASVAITIWPVP
jgi:hypothetical protein